MAKKSTEPDARARRHRAAGAAASTGAAAHDEARRSPTYDEIAEAAYRRYLSRGGEHGRDFDDWLEAERELKDKSG